MVRALVTGGSFDSKGEGIVWHVDLAQEHAECVLRWEPDRRLQVPGKGFAGAARRDNTLYAAAHAAVVRIDLPRLAVTGVLHDPGFNDLHHVAVDGDHLHLANTGQCTVDTFTTDGVFVASRSVLPLWAQHRRFAGHDPDDWDVVLGTGWRAEVPPPWGTPAADGYHSEDRHGGLFHQQKVRDHLHLNHVARVGGRLTATAFSDGSLRDLTTLDRLWHDPTLFPHDGVEHGDGLWLTAIDGTLIELDAATFEERRRIQVFDTGHHGWCRGLAVTEDHLLVGLTEVRPSRLPRHRWSEAEPATSETSVLLLERASGRLLSRVDLTAARHHKLYSILPMGTQP